MPLDPGVKRVCITYDHLYMLMGQLNDLQLKILLNTEFLTEIKQFMYRKMFRRNVMRIV